MVGWSGHNLVENLSGGINRGHFRSGRRIRLGILHRGGLRILNRGKLVVAGIDQMRLRQQPATCPLGRIR